MERLKSFTIELNADAYCFYSETARLLKYSIEFILSDTLNKYAKMIMRKSAKEDE